MALIECKEPVFDRQVNKVLALLDEGKEKEDIAEELGYSNPASLDNYMRRRNFAWESRDRKFVPAAEKYSGKARNNLLQLKGVSKAALVISLFTEDGANPKDIAEQTGFTSHNEMATFMKRKKYEWDVKKNNYTKVKKEEENNSNVRQLNFESEALEEVLIEMLQGINELKSGKKKAVKNGATDDEADEDVMLVGALEGTLKALGDPYTQFLTKEAYEELMQDTQGTYEGIGVYITASDDNKIMIVAPIEDTPAERV